MTKKRHDDELPPEDEQVTETSSHAALMQQLGTAEQKANDNWDRVLRMQAELDNAKRRAKLDVENAHKYALEKFAGELLPIVDSLELCATSVPPDMKEAAKSVVDGVELTLKMFHTAMDKFGIKQVHPVGKPFNPEVEQAISMQYDPEQPAGTVLSVLQKGYTLNGRLLRPALVVVSKTEE